MCNGVLQCCQLFICDYFGFVGIFFLRDSNFVFFMKFAKLLLPCHHLFHSSGLVNKTLLYILKFEYINILMMVTICAKNKTFRRYFHKHNLWFMIETVFTQRAQTHTRCKQDLNGWRDGEGVNNWIVHVQLMPVQPSDLPAQVQKKNVCACMHVELSDRAWALSLNGWLRCARFITFIVRSQQVRYYV